MSTLIAVMATILALLTTAVAYTVGVRDGTRQATRHQYQKLGLTPGGARRYRQAIRILERLEGRTDSSGVLAGDTLSAETQAMVAAWMADYRKETPPE